jgi:hypothetical protein
VKTFDEFLQAVKDHSGQSQGPGYLIARDLSEAFLDGQITLKEMLEGSIYFGE